ncbi:MAG TPA: CvpA family protein [Bacteroidales bacterium]|nr:CvpA family protein [Bacteroidales bacterium]
MTFNYLDLVLALPIVLLAIMGFRKGLIKELASLAALILGIYLAVMFSDIVAGWLIKYVEISHRWIFIIAFILTFVAVVLLVSLLGRALDKIASLALMGIINRVLGLLFGIFKGIFIMSVFILLFNMIDIKENILKSDVKNKSLLYRPVETVAPFVLKNITNLTFDNPPPDKVKGRNKRLDQMVRIEAF